MARIQYSDLQASLTGRREALAEAAMTAIRTQNTLGAYAAMVAFGEVLAIELREAAVALEVAERVIAILQTGLCSQPCTCQDGISFGCERCKALRRAKEYGY